MSYENRLLPYSLIVAAASGDPDAVNEVLAHYSGYILSLCKKPLYDEDGRLYTCINEDLRRNLETKLISKILAFNVV